MAETFTKLVSSITDSSIWAESPEVCKVWVTLLAMAGADGIVRASILGLAHRARLPVDVTREALDSFQAPDPNSRTADHDGRRIAPVEGGWLLLNHARYRGSSAADDIEARRANDRERKRRQREKTRHVTREDGNPSSGSSARPVENGESGSSARTAPDSPVTSRDVQPPDQIRAEQNRSGQQQHRSASPSPSARRRDAVSELWAWFESERVDRGYGRKRKALSTKARRMVDGCLKHIRETLQSDHDGALASQREHLAYRLEQAQSDAETRRRLGQDTPWRTGWWDWWRANVEDKPTAPEKRRRAPERPPAEINGEPLTDDERALWTREGGYPAGQWAVENARAEAAAKAGAATTEWAP